MVIKEIFTRDHLGRFFVMKQKGVKWSSYYKTIDALRPLFHKSEFTEVITGFYLNISEDYDAVRILYFVCCGQIFFNQEFYLLHISGKRALKR